MSRKIGGCCSLCDVPCFEVLSVHAPHEKNAGAPKRIGPPVDGATRVTFLLFNGRRTDMTFCGPCAESLGIDNYALLWRKNLAGWLYEQDGDPSKFKDEFANGLLCELGRQDWKELIADGR